MRLIPHIAETLIESHRKVHNRALRRGFMKEFARVVVDVIMATNEHSHMVRYCEEEGRKLDKAYKQAIQEAVE